LTKNPAWVKIILIELLAKMLFLQEAPKMEIAKLFLQFPQLKTKSSKVL